MSVFVTVNPVFSRGRETRGTCMRPGVSCGSSRRRKTTVHIVHYFVLCSNLHLLESLKCVIFQNKLFYGTVRDQLRRAHMQAW